jgi:hypothetical protein
MRWKAFFGIILIVFLAYPVSAATIDTETVSYYIDPDYTGSTMDGSADRPWDRLDAAAWAQVDATLASSDVHIYFSAREAGADTDEVSTNSIGIYRNDQSSHRATLDGMSRYNTNDADPTWQDYSGGSRFHVKAGYPTDGADSDTKRDYITIRGFRLEGGVGGYGGQSLYYGGGDHVIIENNDVFHNPATPDGALFQFGYAHLQSGGGNGGCTDIIIRNNRFHDSLGECIYIGGSENTGLPAHSHLVIENNTLWNCGIYGAQGDCIDIKDMITDVTIRDNRCFNGTGTDNINGIVSHSPIIAEHNVIGGMMTKGISLGSGWGNGFSGTRIRYNIIYGNGEDGVYISSDSAAQGIKDTLIDHNTLYGNRNGIVLGSSADGGLSGVTVTNNIISGNSQYGINSWGILTPTVTNNDLYGNGNDFVGAGNIHSDPQLVYPQNPAGPDGVFYSADDGFRPTLGNAVCSSNGTFIGALSCVVAASIGIWELDSFIGQWRSGSLSISELMDKIRLWKQGC